MSDINVQTFSGKVNISNNLKVGQGHLFVDTLNNQVGLNTNTPAAGLHVNGNTFVNTDLRVGTKVLIDSGATDSNVIEVTNGNIKAEFLHGDGSNITSISADNIDGTLSQWTGAVGSSIYYAENVGIGLTNPQFKLDVNGDANVGVLTATFLHGDGSNITNIVSSQWEGDPGNPIYYDGNVGIATSTAPTRTLEVGSNLYVEDAGSNVLTVDGNVAATNITIGDATIVASQGLDHVTNENNTTTQVVQFNHPTTGFITAANAVIGGTLSLQNFALSQSYGLENVTDVNNTTGDTIVSSNATTGFQATANVSVGRDALVTGNVTVGKDLTVSEEATFSSNVTIAKDLEVSGNVTNLDVLSNVNLLSVSNVVSIKKDSNVVTEFNRSKKLIKYPRVALTANSSGGYVASASSYYNTGVQPYEAFDVVNGGLGWESGPNSQNGNGRYSSGSTFNTTYLNDNPTLGEGGFQTTAGSATYTGEWVQIQLPVAIQSTTHVFGNSDANSDWNLRIPQSGVILGSTNGSSWEPIHSFDDTIKNATITVSHTNYYSYFRLVALSVGTNQTLANVPEWEIFGIPEHDPDAAGTDVKVTSYPNAPNTDWLEVYYDAKEPSSYPGTGGTVVDLSGNSRNGTLNGGVGFDSTYKAFTFDEADDYITLDTGKTGNYVFSVSLWFKSSGNSVETLFHMNGDYATNNTVWLYGSGTNLYIDFINNSYSCDTGKEIADNMWHHTSFVYNGNGESGRDIYLDGVRLSGLVLSGSGAGSDLNLTSTSSISRIGALNHTSGIIHKFKGSIANFRLFNRAITSDEVWQLYSYQKEYFGHGDLSMTFKAGRLGIGTSEPRAVLDVRGNLNVSSFINYDSAWFYANDGDTSGTGDFNNYTGFVPWNQLQTGSTHFTTASASTSGGYYTAPVDGIYHFDTSVLNYPDARSGITGIFFSVNDDTSGTNANSYGYNRKTNMPGQENMIASATFRLNEGDTVKVYVDNIDCYTQTGHAFFSGYLVNRI